MSSGTASADYQKGLDAYNAGDYATALREWRPLANRGNARAQNNLGHMYYNGEGVPQDDVEAVKWFRLAADQGNNSAKGNLRNIETQLQRIDQIPEPDPTAISYLKAKQLLDNGPAYDQLAKEDQDYINKIDYVEFKNSSFDILGDMTDATTILRSLFASQCAYTVIEKNINGSTASLVISVSAPDYSQFMGEILMNSMSQIFRGQEPSDSVELLEGLADKKNIPKKITKQEVELRLEGGEWRVFENVKAVYEKEQEADQKRKEVEKREKIEEDQFKKELEEVEKELEELVKELGGDRAKLVDFEVHEEDQLKQAYVQNIEIFEFDAKFINTILDNKVPGVRFALRNNGNRSLDKVNVTVYFHDKNNQPIYEKTFHPISVGLFSSNDSPLKPNYIWRNKASNYYTIEQLGPEWSGEAKAVISDIEFSE